METESIIRIGSVRAAFCGSSNISLRLRFVVQKDALRSAEPNRKETIEGVYFGQLNEMYHISALRGFFPRPISKHVVQTLRTKFYKPSTVFFK